MRKPFNGTYRRSQAFNDACCRASYAKFGMQGHNGQDYALPEGTPDLAPHSGKVIEAGNDPAGYGLYVKIDNGVEGSVLAHLKSYSVKVGDQVNEGQQVGISGNTGNSTGAHLHWGYYRVPRNRQNGFLGYIDQEPYISSTPLPIPPNNTMETESQTDKKVQFDRITNHLKDAGFLPTAASEDYTKPKNPDGLFNKVKELWADRLVDRPKAAMLDQVRNRLGLPGNASVNDILAKMVPVDEAAIRKDQNNKTIAEVISKAQTLIK